MQGRIVLVVLSITLCAAVAQGANSPAIGRPGTGLPSTLDVEAKIARPMAIEVPGLVPISVRLTNRGDTSALVDSVKVTISDGYSSFSTGIPLSPGESRLVFMPVPWICPADSEETCTAWITYPEDMNHHNDTDVVVVNSVWQRTYDGGHGSDGGRSVILSYPGFVSAGWTTTIAGDLDVYLVKTNG